MACFPEADPGFSSKRLVGVAALGNPSPLHLRPEASEEYYNGWRRLRAWAAVCSNVALTVLGPPYHSPRPLRAVSSLPECARDEPESGSCGGVLVHAPTVCVALLRQAAEVLESAAEILPNETIFFPEKEASERQPIELAGRISLANLADLVQYLSDMLEV